MLAGVAVPARVRAGRAENLRSFQSDNGGGYVARVIFLSRDRAISPRHRSHFRIPSPAAAAFHFRIRGTPGPRFVRAIRVEATAVLLRR